MRKKSTIIALVAITVTLLYSFDETANPERYKQKYFEQVDRFRQSQKVLLNIIKQSDLSNELDINKIQDQIAIARRDMKGADFWLRYFEPIDYRRINGPLPVEWETEVFEKFEAPYKREGTGLTQAQLYLDEENPGKKQLEYLIASSDAALNVFYADSVTEHLPTYHHFYLCNRLYLLNLAAIYTTGFECPDTSLIIPELRSMMAEVNSIYNAFNESFPDKELPTSYISLYNKALDFVQQQPINYSEFDHFSFIKNYINPLFLQNQQLINKYKVFSKNLVDYSLNKYEVTIFNKNIYNGQNTKGIFHRIEDKAVLDEIEQVGKLLFYDPILSANNERSCASCHKPTEYLTDTVLRTSMQFNKQDFLPRNTPSLINVQYNHLLMLDGKHISLQDQAKGVMTTANEMASNEQELVEKVMSCKEYNKIFTGLLKYTPTEKEVNINHITSALTLYYTKFSNYYSPFDEAVNENKPIEPAAVKGFNLFMSKAQCATCHFVPQFNGVKPPYVGSEFEVLGVPADTAFTRLSPDSGRHMIHKADEMLNAFRTGSIRNIQYTKPYMHNGVFNTLEEVVDFYNNGGGVGRGLKVDNQTLAADSLGLSAIEKKNLIKFMTALSEKITFDTPPEKLPQSKNKALNTRKAGGEY